MECDEEETNNEEGWKITITKENTEVDASIIEAMQALAFLARAIHKMGLPVEMVKQVVDTAFMSDKELSAEIKKTKQRIIKKLRRL